MTINDNIADLSAHIGDEMQALDTAFQQTKDTADLALTISNNLHRVYASSLSMVTGGSNNDAAVSAIPEGQQVDLEGGVYNVSAVPSNIRAFNGGWSVAGKTYAAPRTFRSHPLSGNYDYTIEYSGQTVHTGPVMYDSDSHTLYRVYTLSPTHYPNYGSMVYMEYSVDMGASWAGTRTIYSAPSDRIVVAMLGRKMNGKLGILLSQQDSVTAPTFRDILLLSLPLGSAKYAAPTVTTVSGSFTAQHFLYGEVYEYPASVGGHDTDGFIAYTYTNGNAYALTTVNNGASWSEHLVYTNGDIPGALAGEISMCRVGREDKWVGYMRPSNTPALNQFANYVAITTTDMLSFSVADSGITNIGTDTAIDSGAVGHPPYVLYEGGFVNLYVPYRENWTDSKDTENEQQLVVFSDKASDVYSNSGVMVNQTKDLVAYIPSRATGMLFTASTPYGYVGWLRAFETVYASAGSGSVASSGVVEFAGFQVARRTIQPRRNEAENPTFNLWTRGTSFPGITADNTPVADRFRMYTSESGGGAVFTVSRVSVPTSQSVSMPFRSTYGMRIEAPASVNNKYSGFEQVHYGEAAVKATSGRDITVHLIGRGTAPSSRLSLNVITFSGTRTINTAVSTFQEIPNSDGVWYITATVAVPPLESTETFSGIPYVIYRVRTTSVGVGSWDMDLYGFKVEFGKNPTLFELPDLALDRLKCARYVQVVGEENGYFTNGWRKSDGRFASVVNLSVPMVTTPTVYLTGPVSDLRIDSRGSGTVPTALNTSDRNSHTYKLLLDHDTSAVYEAGGVWSTNVSTYLVADCE